jgi:hypothetical protein
MTDKNVYGMTDRNVCPTEAVKWGRLSDAITRGGSQMG